MENLTQKVTEILAQTFGAGTDGTYHRKGVVINVENMYDKGTRLDLILQPAFTNPWIPSLLRNELNELFLPHVVGQFLADDGSEMQCFTPYASQAVQYAKLYERSIGKPATVHITDEFMYQRRDGDTIHKVKHQ